MQPTGNSMNIENSSYHTVVISKESFDNVKQKLGDDFTWKYDEKTNMLYLTERSKPGKDFSTEYGEDMSPLVHDWYAGRLTDRWDD